MQKAERYQLDKSQICRSAEQKMGFVLCSYFALSDGKVKLRFFLITMQALSGLGLSLTTEVFGGVGGDGGGGRVVIISKPSSASGHAIVHILVLASLCSSHDSG